jgi:hypothetical protein
MNTEIFLLWNFQDMERLEEINWNRIIHMMLWQANHWAKLFKMDTCSLIAVTHKLIPRAHCSKEYHLECVHTKHGVNVPTFRRIYTIIFQGILKMAAISWTETSVNIDQTPWHDILKYSIHNQCREKMLCFIRSAAGGPYANRQVHPTPSIPFYYDFLSYHLNLGLQNWCFRSWTTTFWTYASTLLSVMLTHLRSDCRR